WPRRPRRPSSLRRPQAAPAAQLRRRPQQGLRTAPARKQARPYRRRAQGRTRRPDYDAFAFPCFDSRATLERLLGSVDGVACLERITVQTASRPRGVGGPVMTSRIDAVIETPRLLLRVPSLKEFEPWARFMADEEAARYIGRVQPPSVVWRSIC